MATSLDETWPHGSRRARGKPQGDELAEHQVGEFPEHFSLGLGEFIERRQAARVSSAAHTDYLDVDVVATGEPAQ